MSIGNIVNCSVEDYPQTMAHRYNLWWRPVAEIEEEEAQKNDPRFVYDENAWAKDNFFKGFVEFYRDYDDFNIDIKWLFEEEDIIDISRLFATPE